MATRKISSIRYFFVALLDDGAGAALLIETPESQQKLSAPQPQTLRINRALMPITAAVGDEAMVTIDGATVEGPKQDVVTYSISASFAGERSTLSPAARVAQAGKSGVTAREIATLARSMLPERPALDLLPGTTWVVADPLDQPALAGKIFTIVEVDGLEAICEVVNAAGEYTDKERRISLDWLDTVLQEVRQ